MITNGWSRKLAVDLGGVIVELATFHEDNLHEPAHLLEIDGARQALRQLAGGFDAVHVVSKCGPRSEELSRIALAESGFLRETGIAVDRLHFCRERAEKATICADLGITHVIDDRMEILALLRDVVPQRYLFGDRPPGDAPAGDDVIPVLDWTAVLAALS